MTEEGARDPLLAAAREAEEPPRTPQVSAGGDPSLFCAEKALLLLHLAQVYALVWQASQPWGAPYLWALYTQWVNWANLDYFSTSAQGALIGTTADLNAPRWGTMPGYPAYALAFAAAPYGALLLARSLWAGLQRTHRHRLAAALLVLLQLAYLPVCLAVFRMYYCNAEGNLDCDRAVSCSSAYYAATTAVCSLLVAPLVVGAPLLLAHLVRPSVVYKLSRDHEKRTQATELAYLLGLDDTWLARQTWLCSSFHRKRSFFLVELLELKLLLLVLFVFARASYALQGCLVWLVVAASCLRCLLKWPYRVLSSNLTLLAAMLVLLVAVSYYAMNALGVNNFFTVASNEFYGLLLFFGLLLLFLLGLSVHVLLYPGRHQWPAARTLTTLTSAPESSARVGKWIAALREARDVRLAAFLCADETLDIRAVESCARRLRRCWLGARARGSLLEVLLGDALDALLRLHAERYPRAARRDEAWERAAGAAAEAAQARDQDSALVSPRARRVLLKVLAFRGMGSEARERGASPSPPVRVSPRGDGERGFVDLEDYDPCEEEDEVEDGLNIEGFTREVIGGKYRLHAMQEEDM